MGPAGGIEGIGGVKVDIRGDWSHLKSDLEKAQSVVKESLSGFSLDGLNQAFKESQQHIQNSLGAIKQFGEQLTQVGTQLSVAVTAPLVGFGAAIVSVAGKMEQAEIAFTGLLKSGQQAAAFLNELKGFAASTPFEFPDLVQASKRMLALGFEAKNIIPTLRTIGDAAAGLGAGAEGINRITLALGQMTAKGKVSAQEMNQLAEVGIRGWEILAKAIGVSIPEAMKLAEKGAISAAQAVPAILAGMNKEFAGQMEKQAQTLLGMWSNFKDQVTFILMDFGKVLLPILKQALTAATPLIDMLNGMVHWFAELPAPVQNAAVALVALLAAAGPLLLIAGQLVSAFVAVKGALLAVGAALGVGGGAGVGAALASLGPLLAGIAAAVAAVWVAWKVWNLPEVQAAVDRIAEALSRFWQDTLRPLAVSLAKVADEFLNIANAIIRSGLERAWSLLSEVAESFKQSVMSLKDPLSGLVESVLNLKSAAQPLIDILAEVAKGVSVIYAAIYGTGLAAAIFIVKTGFENLTEVLKIVIESFAEKLRLAINVAKIAIDGIAKAVQFLRSLLPDVTGYVNLLVGALQKLPGFDFALGKLQSSFAGVAKEAKKVAEETQSAVSRFGTYGPSLEQLGITAKKAGEDIGAASKEAERAAERYAKFRGEILAATIPMRIAAEEAARLKREQDELVESIVRIRIEIAKNGPPVLDLSRGLAELNVEVSRLSGPGGVPKLSDETRALLREFGVMAGSGPGGVPWVSKALQEQFAPALKAAAPETVKLAEGMKQTSSAATEMGKIMGEVGRAVSDFVMDAGRMLFSGDGSFAERFMRMCDQLRDVALNAFLKPISDGISKFVQGELAGLLSGLDQAGTKIGKLFGSGTAAIPSSPGASGGTGGAGGLGGGAGLMGTLGAVGAIGSMISSIVGNFQMAKQEGTLNQIERNTAQISINLAELLRRANELWPHLQTISDYMWSKQAGFFAEALYMLSEMNMQLVRIGDMMAYGTAIPLTPLGAAPNARSAVTINIYGDINTGEDLNSLLDQMRTATGGTGGQT